jgi:hypothetical protein
VRGASSRYYDAAFVRAGMPANRLEQINMIGTTNESKFDSLTTTLRGRARNATMSVSYVLSNSRAWGGQPTASYSGNGIAITPTAQFLDRCRRSFSSRRRGRTRRLSAPTATATARSTSSIGCARA